MSNDASNTATHTSDTPQLLLEHHLKELRLPTMLREYDHIARHQRSYERETVVFDPLHYLALLEQKTRALDQAAPLAGWKLPDCFAVLRRLLEARLRKHGSREYVQVLRLMETFDLSEVSHAIEDALQLGTISFDAVRHLMLCRIERRPPRLDMENYPHLPLAQVHTTQAADYMSLLVEVCA